MEIKARVCKDEFAQCNCCLKDKDKVLDIFEIRIPLGSNGMSESLRLCDECVDKLFFKTLRCICYTNGRLKNQHDIAISSKRRAKKMKEQYGEDKHLPINPPKEEDEWEKVIAEYGE